MAIRIPFIQKQGPAEQALPPMSGQGMVPANSPGDNPTLQAAGQGDPLGQMLGHTQQQPAVGDVRPVPGRPPYGASGRANFYGLPQPDELNQKLIGPRGLQILDDMYWSDAHIRRLVLAAWSPVVAGTWSMDPFGGEDAAGQDKQIAEKIWQGLNHFMTPNFAGHLYEIGPALLRFGFVPFEQQWDTWKTDGKTLLFPRKLGFMLPRTVWKWWQDDYGDLTWIGQILPNRSDVTIPRSELCYYRLAAEGDNWMGRSLLRHAYKHFVFKDRLERIQAIGCERSAKGVPVVYRSPEISEAILNQLEQALTMLHVSEVGYLIMPGWKMGQAPADADPTNQFLVDTVQYNSASDDSIAKAIDYHQRAISASFLTDFLELGHHQIGARATADIQEDPFLTALHGALMPPILPELNRLVDRIRQINWPDANGSPQLKVTLHDDASLTEIAAYVQQLQQAGAIQIDSELEDWLRERAAMPSADPNVRSKRQQVQDAQDQATIAQAQATAQDPHGLKAAAAKASGGSTAPSPGSQQQAKRAAMPAGGMGKQMAMRGNQTRLDQEPDGPKAAGLVVHAADTGRVLMIQRSKDKADDPGARSRWEFPGGKIDKGESSFSGGRREWQEETGAKLPKHATHIGSFTTPDGVYEAHGFRVDHEHDVKLRGTHDPDEVKDVRWRPLAHLHDPEMRDKVRAMAPQVRAMLGRRTLDAFPWGLAKLLDAGNSEADRTICFDFDGVIADKKSGDLVRDPVTGETALDVIPKLSEVFRLIVFTARTNLDKVRAWLDKHGLGQYITDVTNVKPPATAYFDDNAVQFTTWGHVPDEVMQQYRRGLNPPQLLDQPQAPPNLRESTDPNVRCGTCKMFDPTRRVCWSYETPNGQDYPVDTDDVCDSWALSPSGQKILDDAGFAPMSGGTNSESGLQMVPETGCGCCDDCGPDCDGDCCEECGHGG